MNSLPPLLLKAVFALCVGLALVCTVTRPMFTTLQELHELEHGATVMDEAVADGSGDDDGGLEDIFHAPHCCVHAVVLPPTLLFTSLVVTQPPPHFVAAMPRASPWVRLLRPPISV